MESGTLAYKKTDHTLKLHADAKLPFRLNSRHNVDFTQNQFDVGLARLREHIQWLSTNEGRIRSLKDRVADATRDLRRASGNDKDVIEKNIVEIKKEIGKLEKNKDGIKKRTRTYQTEGCKRRVNGFFI
jgi:hypothetical protein